MRRAMLGVAVPAAAMSVYELPASEDSAPKP